MSIESGRPAPADYAQVPEEGEPPHRYYEKAMEAIGKFGYFQEHFKGANRENLKALQLVLWRMLYDDYNETIPEGAVSHLGEYSEEDYTEYLQALGTIENYIHENKPQH